MRSATHARLLVLRTYTGRPAARPTGNFAASTRFPLCGRTDDDTYCIRPAHPPIGAGGFSGEPRRPPARSDLRERCQRPSKVCEGETGPNQSPPSQQPKVCITRRARHDSSVQRIPRVTKERAGQTSARPAPTPPRSTASVRSSAFINN